jgi:hypothetical protein
MTGFEREEDTAYRTRERELKELFFSFVDT